MGDFEGEADHGLIDGADLLDIEGAVGQALAAEDQEFSQDAPNDTIGDGGDAVFRGADILAGVGAAFEEGEAVGIEEVALAGGHLEIPVLVAAVDEAEEGEQLWPSTEALIHGVVMQGGIAVQALEEGTEGVVLIEERAGRQQAAVFGEEEEDEAEEDGELAVIDVVGISRHRLAQQVAVDTGIGGLETANEFVEGLQHLLGKLGGDAGLHGAAVAQQGGKLVFRLAEEKHVATQQQLEGAEDGAAHGAEHVRVAEGEVAGVFALRGIDEAEGGFGKQQASRDAGLA